jgi:23S rRNA (guanine745-N1)-methyltransferase
VAGAGERHLFGLKELVYDDPYLNDPRRDLPTRGDALTLVDTRNVTFRITVEEPPHIAALFSMTPYYWRTSREGHGRLAAAETLTTEVSFDLHIYEKH